MSNIIELKDVTLSYTMIEGSSHTLKDFIISFFKRRLKKVSFHALNGVSLNIQKGEVVGIVGENGAGKSTLLKIVSGIFRPSSGSVKVEGNLIPLIELGCGFDTELTGRENIYLNGSIVGFSKEYLDSKVDEIIEFSELGSFINQPLRTYSSGMLMRLGFSIAVISKPEILIVDEILAVGDDKFQKKSLNKILELMSGGTTVLYVSHNLPSVRELCSRVVWLEHGKVVMDGDAATVCDAYANRQ